MSEVLTAAAKASLTQLKAGNANIPAATFARLRAAGFVEATGEKSGEMAKTNAKITPAGRAALG